MPPDWTNQGRVRLIKRAEQVDCTRAANMKTEGWKDVRRCPLHTQVIGGTTPNSMFVVPPTRGSRETSGILCLSSLGGQNPSSKCFVRGRSLQCGRVLTVPVGLQLGQQLVGHLQVRALHGLQEVLLLPHSPPLSPTSCTPNGRHHLLNASC